MKHDSRQRYGTISRVLHWGMALLIAWQLLKIFDRINDGEHWVGETLVPWHISIGSVLLVLIVLRIAWATRQRGHRPGHDPATAFLVKAGHALLYAGMALMPLTGISAMIGTGYGWTAFGIELVAPGEEVAWMASVGSFHSPIAWILLTLIIGHSGIALLHHFVKRDDVLRRMM